MWHWEIGDGEGRGENNGDEGSEAEWRSRKKGEIGDEDEE